MSNRIDVKRFGVFRFTEALHALRVVYDDPGGGTSFSPSRTQSYLCHLQSPSRAIHGRDLAQRLLGMRNLNFRNFRWLSQNRLTFFEGWKHRGLSGVITFYFFWGAQLEDARHERYVPCVWWDYELECMDIGYKPINSFWGENCPALQHLF